MQATKSDENRVRRLARREGYLLRKSRLKGYPRLDDQGEYMLVEPNRNIPVVGDKYDADLPYIEAWLRD